MCTHTHSDKQLNHNHTHLAAVAPRAELVVERIWTQFGLINVCHQLSWWWVARQAAGIVPYINLNEKWNQRREDGTRRGNSERRCSFWEWDWMRRENGFVIERGELRRGAIYGLWKNERKSRTKEKFRTGGVLLEVWFEVWNGRGFVILPQKTRPNIFYCAKCETGVKWRLDDGY